MRPHQSLCYAPLTVKSLMAAFKSPMAAFMRGHNVRLAISCEGAICELP